MDQAIDARFERVERALTTLIDSIAKYNPSMAMANDLAVADRELSKGLAELQVHQNNHLRIQAMRAEIAAADARIRAAVSGLASTRRDITSTPVSSTSSAATQLPGGSGSDATAGNEVQYRELLSYARRISKTTLPASGITNGVDVDAANNTTTVDTAPASTSSVTHTPPTTETAAQTPVPAAAANGVQTPTATTAGPTGPSGATHLQPPDLYAQPSSGPPSAAPALPEGMAGYLNPNAGALFVPWPSETQVRVGALAANQDLSDRGVDARDYDPGEEARRREAERAAEEERQEAERLAREEEARRMRDEHERRRKAADEAREREIETWRRDSIAEGAAGAPKPPAAGEKKQFQFFGDMDDDDED
ncbi:uncharacterized protein E0L32_000458 [Thyridium curvatum]|uniref:Mediator of RNA polymerase II transcription subunit 4 n=1 Tax=Thyridium curvatum TaxID=1093900 RepID=A0A507B5S4_9PEZI|nr:uncharacterized protein E0L32_000458 [Thyridium curvatum]TPX14064.1 hypothetical protein E0L32_000458 [Thyridium curvatum]